jgi:acetate kinase
MKVLAVNCGSSSVKCQLFETSLEAIRANRDRELGKVLIEQIGTPEAVVRTGTAQTKRPIADHHAAIEVAVGALTKTPLEIEAVGHRVVHGGERFSAPVEMDDGVVAEIESLCELAPLHNPENLKGFRAARAVVPQARHVAVFDTAFHQTLSPKAYVYGLPDALWRRHRVRRYGFHGSSHRYLAWRYAQIHGFARDDYRLITCHLGNGCSVSAVKSGKSVDTSMGFTPLEGLLMGTRSGDIDAGAVLHIMAKEQLTPAEMDLLLNRRSGLYGLSTASNDMRTLLDLCGRGDTSARLAVDTFCYRARKYLGAYYAVLNGCDAVIFTGGIGENASAIRAGICESLEALGIQIDPARNEAAVGVEASIARDGAKVEVWVIPTDEGLVIARDTLRTLAERHDSQQE